MGIEDQAGSEQTQHGCRKCDSRELLEISLETQCSNYWYADNSFPENGAIRTNHKKLELRKYMDKKVAAIAFACPCKPGEPIDITRGGTIETIGFAYYRNWVALDPCEVNEEVVCEIDCDPYEHIPFEEKYRRHIADKTAALTEAVNTRYELMATFVKLWGSYMVDGPKMDGYMVDFERDPCLCAVLRTNYDDVNTFPMDDLHMFEHMFKRATQKNGRGGVMCERYVFGVDAWMCFSMHHQVQRKGFTAACNCTEPGNDLGIGADECGMTFAGELNGKPVYIDGRTYVDTDGVEKYYMPQDALMLEGAGMRGARAHSTIYSPSADFQPGDFHFRQYWCEKDEVWTLDVQGSILMFPRDVNTVMLIRNVGRTRTFPGDKCTDLLLDEEGQVITPPKANKGLTPDQWESALQQAADGEYFSLCCALVGRTPPRVPCNNGMKADCIPGKWLTIVPGIDPCPTAPRRCVTKEFLLSQGYTEYAIAEAIFYGGIEVSDLETCLLYGDPLAAAKAKAKPASAELKEKMGTGDE